MLDFRRKLFWIKVGAATCLLVVIFLTIPPQLEGNVIPSRQTEPGKNQFSPLPPPDQGAIEIHRKIAAGLNREIQEQTKRLYGAVFQQLGLPVGLQERVIDILTQQEKQLEQQAIEAVQAGSFPAPPSPEAIRAQQLQEDQQLRSVLGDAAFAAFNEYRATIPDRIIVDAMNQQGANLSESQSQQLLQILRRERQQIIAQAGITQNLDSMSPDKAVIAIQQQEALLQQAVAQRVQNILTPDQVTTLQGLLSRQLSIGSKVR